MTRDGGPAFPRPLADAVGDKLFTRLRDNGANGMTLRDYFAAAALPSVTRGGRRYEDIAGDAYMIADAMLAAREATDDPR